MFRVSDCPDFQLELIEALEPLDDMEYFLPRRLLAEKRPQTPDLCQNGSQLLTVRSAGMGFFAALKRLNVFIVCNALL